MKPLDPDYVEEMSREGWDPHISLAAYAGVITKEEERFFQWYQQMS
jgi:hypothetical protein